MRRFMVLLAGLVVLPLAVGCSANSQVIRGQSPEYCPPAQQGTGGCPHGRFGNCPHGCFGNCLHGFCQGSITGVGSPRCFDPCWGNCPPTYPPAGAMPGVVQYPYYTLKGPDCFFHQEDHR